MHATVNLNRRHFQMQLFAGALRVNLNTFLNKIEHEIHQKQNIGYFSDILPDFFYKDISWIHMRHTCLMIDNINAKVRHII